MISTYVLLLIVRLPKALYRSWQRLLRVQDGTVGGRYLMLGGLSSER